MQKSTSLTIAIAEHELHVMSWGSHSNPPLIMWHGLARNGRDFDILAQALADEYWVLCPDTIGRGLSTWSKNPDVQYTVPYYCQLALGMMDVLEIPKAHWIGTSMGGLIGMGLAAHLDEYPSPRILSLVLNDVGPEINETAMDRIKAYVQTPFECRTLREYELFLRFAYRPFGIVSDNVWAAITRHSVRRLPNGNLTHHYDPAVMDVLVKTPGPLNMWAFYDSITAPTLVLRGEDSDLFPSQVADEMTRRGPKARLATIKGCGHAPFLDNAEQITLVRDFLAANR